ncbi:MAG TPA: hypothetical protein VGN25_00840 [Solirubrobacteraceae bacterium]|nr:hypothetical protein [Solirubrobacteraceae bacterium]
MVHLTAQLGRWSLRLAMTLIACFATGVVPASANAAITTLGSPLSQPATLNTAENLGYTGSSVAVPPAPDAPNGVYHVYHDGVDSALWNASLASGAPQAPQTGQAVKISLEGCAEPSSSGAAPLTQIHFQDLSPLPEGGAHANITSQAFDIPVCGQGGASGSTVSTYEPINLCVAAGDYVAFNDEGGFAPGSYPNGVPYRVIGATGGSTMDSYLRDNGTGNGATFAPADVTSEDGFARNSGEELMMQVTLGTGADATHICAGGTQGAPPVLAPIRVSPQTDGINHERIVSIAVFCRLQPTCKGVATLSVSNLSGYAGTSGSHPSTVGRASFNLAPNKTTHLPIRLSSSVMGVIRKHHGIAVTLTAVVAGNAVAQTIKVKIL